MHFDWDTGNKAKCEKHGLTRALVEAFFRSEPHVSPDPAHSKAEQRFIAVGRMPDGRAVFVAFCWRGDKIRPISARYMHEKEVRAYENRPRYDH